MLRRDDAIDGELISNLVLFVLSLYFYGEIASLFKRIFLRKSFSPTLMTNITLELNISQLSSNN
jgi:hypothetical protein